MSTAGRIAVLKLGWSYYQNNVDRNSGGFETQLILRSIREKTNKQVDFLSELPVQMSSRLVYDCLIVIGGRQTQGDYFKFHNVLAKKRIFIASDIDALTCNRPFICCCDLLLTQTNSAIPGYGRIEQQYSFLPELFFNDIVQNKNEVLASLDFMDGREPKLFFGGSEDGRKDHFKKYFSDEEFCVTISKCKEYDERLPYEDYIEVSSKYAYTIMIVTEEARGLGWITSRLFEALAHKVVPFADLSYDSNNMYYDSNKFSVLRVNQLSHIKAGISITQNQLKKECGELFDKAFQNQDRFFDALADVL